MSLDVSLYAIRETEVFDGNITHNLGAMAEAAGIYKELWRPEEIGIEKAEQLIEPLQTGLDRLLSDPGTFAKHTPENGWGNYDGLVQFVREYLAACRENPDARIVAYR